MSIIFLKIHRYSKTELKRKKCNTFFRINKNKQQIISLNEITLAHDVPPKLLRLLCPINITLKK